MAEVLHRKVICGVLGDENGREKMVHKLVFGGLTEGFTDEELEKNKMLCLVQLPEEEQKEKGLYAVMRPSPFPLSPFYSFYETLPIGGVSALNFCSVLDDDDDDEFGDMFAGPTHDGHYLAPHPIDEHKPPPFFPPPIEALSPPIRFSEDENKAPPFVPQFVKAGSFDFETSFPLPTRSAFCFPEEHKPSPFCFPPSENRKPLPFWFPAIEKRKPPPFTPPPIEAPSPPIRSSEKENKAPPFVPLSDERLAEVHGFHLGPFPAVYRPTRSASSFSKEHKPTRSSKEEHNPYAAQGKRKNVPQEISSFLSHGTRKKGLQEISSLAEASFGSFTGFSPFGWSDKKHKAPGSVPIARSEDEHKPTGSSFAGQHPTGSPFARAKEENKAAEGAKCGCGAYLTPYCICTSKRYRDIDALMPLPEGASGSHLKLFVPVWRAYFIQSHQSHCFDIDDHPGFSRYGGANVTPLLPSVDFNSTARVLTELASLAISEHNDKESNVFKYQLLKIEKVNFELYDDTYYSYYMTVKVLNLTLATPIETFQIHAGVKVRNDEKVIYCCRPKPEETIGLPSCDACDGKLCRGEELLQSVNSLSLSHWDGDNFIPRGASKEHLEAFHRIYERYDRQICQSNGFDFDVYPGDAKAAAYIPYLDFEREADMLRELANHAIQDYNNRETNVYTYTFSYIEKVNYLFAARREFFMTVKVINSTLRTALETFQIHAYRGPREENIVRLCRKKMLV